MINTKRPIGVTVIGYFYILGVVILLATLGVPQTPPLNVRFGMPQLPEFTFRMGLVAFSFIMAVGYLRLKRWGYWTIFQWWFCCIPIQRESYSWRTLMKEYLCENCGKPLNFTACRLTITNKNVPQTVQCQHCNAVHEPDQMMSGLIIAFSVLVCVLLPFVIRTSYPLMVVIVVVISISTVARVSLVKLVRMKMRI